MYVLYHVTCQVRNLRKMNNTSFTKSFYLTRNTAADCAQLTTMCEQIETAVHALYKQIKNRHKYGDDQIYC